MLYVPDDSTGSMSVDDSQKLLAGLKGDKINGSTYTHLAGRLPMRSTRYEHRNDYRDISCTIPPTIRSVLARAKICGAGTKKLSRTIKKELEASLQLPD